MVGGWVFLAAALLTVPGANVAGVGEVDLRGSWEAQDYRLKAGPQHPVRGLIFFTEKDWLVLFFVLDGQGRPARASSEGGTYRAEGERLEFSHLYHFSAGEALDGLPESPLRREIRAASQAQREAARFKIEGETLTLFFPSGNSMRFRRSSGLE